MGSRMKNIVLTGFMGAGKTAVGRELAGLLDMKLIDIDTEIEISEKMPISEIFEKFGEERFREIESAMVKRISGIPNSIISTGGGVVLRTENMDVLRKHGFIVCLMASPETVLARTANSSDRPLLRVANPIGKIRELMDARRPFYEKADIVIDTEDKTPLQIAEEIMEKIRMR